MVIMINTYVLLSHRAYYYYYLINTLMPHYYRYSDSEVGTFPVALALYM